MKKVTVKKMDSKTVDAAGRTLGRVASEVAVLLMGKNKASFERNTYSGNEVSVVNAAKLRITAKKLAEIFHTRYSGMPGGLRILTGTETAEKRGFKELIRLAVYQMLPSNKLRRTMLKNLKIED